MRTKPAPAHLSDQLCFALYTASKAVAGAYRQRLAQLGLTYPQYLAMLVLWERGEQTVAGLGDALGLDSGTLSPLLKRLEQAELVRRERSARDERVVRILLTARGAELEGRAAVVRTEVEVATGLDAEGFTALRESLDRLSGTIAGAERDGASVGRGGGLN